MKLPAFSEALKRLEPQITGSDDPLVGERTLRYWRAGQLPPPLLLLTQYPELIAALAADMEVLAASTPPQTDS
jgi:hypothetical protein